MAFTGNENHSISSDDAAALTKRYRNQMSSGQIKGGFFGKDTIQRILDQTNCVGIRYYYGLDAQNKQVLVLVGTDAQENDLVSGDIAEMSVPCPSWCGADNALNS